MYTFKFLEAEPLLSFIEKHKSRIVGHTLKEFLIDLWPDKGRKMESGWPVILILDEYCLWIDYLITSDLIINVCSRKELENHPSYGVSGIMKIKTLARDYYEEELGDGETREDIEGRVITDITVQRFSQAFRCDCGGSIRPAGGDYFSTVRLHLDSGTILCFCGEDGPSDLYIEYWCEREDGPRLEPDELVLL